MASATKKAAPPKKKGIPLFFAKQGFDIPFLVVLIALLTIGLACMFSASYVNAYYEDGDSYFYIRKQLIFALAGLAIMLIATFVDYHFWHRLAIPLAALSVVLLVTVLFLPSNGVSRWIALGPIQFQPSEVAKFALIVLFAHMISLNHKDMHTFTKGYLPFMAVLGVFCGLIVVEPHLSGTMLVLVLGFVMMFVGGTRPLYLVLTALLGAAVVVVMIVGLGYEADRVEAWLHLSEVYETNRDQAWQTMQSLFAIGSGGLMGQGFGNSRQKHLFLPEPQNDFIFAIVCEELGFIGAIIIIVLFAVLVWRGFIIAMRAPDKFGFIMAIGLTAQIAIQVAINMAVVTNLLPNTGISLPFFSYGGSSLIMLLGQMGVLLAISRQSTAKLRE